MVRANRIRYRLPAVEHNPSRKEPGYRGTLPGCADRVLVSTKKLPAVSYPNSHFRLGLYWDLDELAPRHLHLFLLPLTICAESVLTGVPPGH